MLEVIVSEVKGQVKVAGSQPREHQLPVFWAATPPPTLVSLSCCFEKLSVLPPSKPSPLLPHLPALRDPSPPSRGSQLSPVTVQSVLGRINFQVFPKEEVSPWPLSPFRPFSHRSQPEALIPQG